MGAGDNVAVTSYTPPDCNINALDWFTIPAFDDFPYNCKLGTKLVLLTLNDDVVL